MTRRGCGTCPSSGWQGDPLVATGERCRDLAVRLRHAGVAHVTVPDDLEALAAAGASRVEYVGNYTAFQALRRHLARTGRPPPSPVASLAGASPAPGMPVAV